MNVKTSLFISLCTSVGPVHNAQVCYIPPPRSFPFFTPVLYPVRSQGKLLSSCPLTTARPETGEGTFFLYCKYLYLATFRSHCPFVNSGTSPVRVHARAREGG
jgi:hypothetical protein